ncbi:MAG: NAD+ synthase [Solirubrobacterales bacterium]|nr:NAD+ synthase [Solirubrobacterales bacterium]
MNVSPNIPSRVELALAQINPIVGDLVGNADLIISQIARAEAEGAQIVVFPELALSGYPPEDLVLREDFLVAARAQLERVASHATSIVSLVGYPMAHPEGVANALSVLADGEVVASYRKQILPNYGVFDERRYFIPGDEPLVINAGGIPIGLSICEDVWFDDPVYSGLAKLGARLILNASASPFHIGKAREREKMLSERANRFDLPIAYCNIVGGQDELVYDGASVVIDSNGEVIARAPQFESELLRCAVDLADPPSRVNPGFAGVDLPVGTAAQAIIAPNTEPREHETYAALMMGIRDYVGKNGFKGVLVGVSGGIDSALVLALACDALGPESVTAVTMPSPFNSAETRADGRELIERLSCPSHEFSIEPMMQSFDAALSPVFAGRKPDQTEENVQARIRGLLLMALSNKFGSMVLTTGNKSEMAVGYATLYGDMAGGFAALKDVPKQLVFALSRWRNHEIPTGSLGGAESPIPVGIIDRPPSAELRLDQSDEATLGSYAELDSIIEQYIEQDLGLDEIVQSGADREFAQRILRMIDLAEYKRRQAPPGVKITHRAFGRDRRMPITARRRYF